MNTKAQRVWHDLVVEKFTGQVDERYYQANKRWYKAMIPKLLLLRFDKDGVPVGKMFKYCKKHYPSLLMIYRARYYQENNNSHTTPTIKPRSSVREDERAKKRQVSRPATMQGQLNLF